ncbi:MAG TPA: hypothetical protein PKB14_10170 [Rubrivivax sp.]|nr:hypothetical protein [Rubrivivax sp.]
MSNDASPAALSSPARPSPQARTFAIRLLGTCFAVVAGCGLFNAAVDPYGLFRWVDRPGFNEVKPRATQASVAFKYRAVDFLSPQTLLLGNSRAEMGWNPQSLPAGRFGSVVNAAMPGKGLDAMIPLAGHAWARSRPATLVIGAEFFDCLEAGGPPAAPAPQALPWDASAAGPWHRFGTLRAFAAEVFSLDATVDSLQTLLAQRNPDAPHLRRDGFQPARDYPRMQAVEGPRKMFLQRDQENARRRMNGPRSIRYDDGQLSECFAALDQLLGKAQERGQAVFVATYPYHARLLELIANAGLGPAYEDWKTALTELVAARQRHGLEVTLRDFGAYHRYAVEPVPSPGQKRSAPKWYWESGHFRSDLGDRMLAVMFGDLQPEGLFGVALSPATLAAHLADVRASRAEFVAEQPEVVAEMAALSARACAPADGRQEGRPQHASVCP